MTAERFLLWTPGTEGFWHGANQTYTTNLREAGKWLRDTAERYADITTPHAVLVPESALGTLALRGLAAEIADAEIVEVPDGC